MELNLEVVLSSSIKRKKPWPRFCWLGQEKESVFLLDDKRISEINMVSGRTKKRTPKLHPLLNNVVTMASSQNGMWLCGLLGSGELFLWNRDKDLLKIAAAVPEVVDMISSIQGRCNSKWLSVQICGDGTRVLLAATTGLVLLWECTDLRDLTGLRDGTIKGHWAHIQPLPDTILPSPQDKEASQHTIFVKTQTIGDACLSAFVFTSAKNLIITCLKIQWEEGRMRVGSVGYSIRWATKTYPMSHLTPACQPVKSRGALVPAFSPDGQLLAVVLNQKQPKATQVLFVSSQNFVSISVGLGGCGSKIRDIPPKYIRSYWVGSVSWSPDGLFLACVLKRGSLLMLARLSELLTLKSSGCNVDFGPAHFLPLHPLVTYRPPVSAGNAEASLSSSSMSVQDVMRQRYSVTWHPRLLYLIVSDGYMATVLRVLGRPSAALLLKTLLKNTSKDIEKAYQFLNKSQTHVRTCLESVSPLNLYGNFEDIKSTVTCGPNTTGSIMSAATGESTLPIFLQDQGTFGGTKELLDRMQTFFEDDSDVDGPPAGSHVEDGGRLEFASMFDTIHALDTNNDTRLVSSPNHETERKTHPHQELGKIQSRLLTTWVFSMSLGNTVENRSHLLKFTLNCVLQFAALLHVMSNPTVHSKKRTSLVSTHLLQLLKELLSFLPWDGTHSDGPQCLGLMIELSKQLLRLLLTPQPDSYQTAQLSSQSLSTAVLILKLVSGSLDHTYSLQSRTVWSSAEKEPLSQTLQCWPSEIYYMPLLQDEKEGKADFVYQGPQVPQRPSSRLFRVWQWLYEITQQYMKELKVLKGCDGWEEEQQRMSVIISQIQIALQASGERIEEGPTLLSYPGEHLYLCGVYSNSADTWRSEIWEESKKSCHRSVFQVTRLCLALLYSLLSQYHLREAQELVDHMASLILHRSGHLRGNTACVTAGSLPCPWLPPDLHSDAAYAVIQTLGRFMASYFTNQPLFILPPHTVAILPPIHLTHGSKVGRLMPLCQKEVARAVRQQQMSEVWTVDYAQDLLLLGGLLPEAVWLAYHLGDWKTAASVSLAYTSYCTDHFDFARINRRELHLPADLEPENIFQAELECLLGSNADLQEHKDNCAVKSFTDPLEGGDWDLLQVSLREILKASVMAGVNVMSSPLSSLLGTAKDLCSCLPALVHNGLYLPSPPLYCPQPSPNTQDPVGPLGQFAEIKARHKVSGVLQRLLLLLRSAHCCHPAAQWYISHLRRARHILYKIKKKYAYPSAAEQEKAFSEGLMKFVTRSGFFTQHKKDKNLDPDTVQTIICFRELCGLCWMLHVRDQLSISCRKYQAVRQHRRDEQIPSDSEVNSACVDALLWARRYLPFSHFLNSEEILQDILLSLISELPPDALVADTLVHAFLKEEESVRVPLREKYNSLLQRLRHCNVLDEEKEEASELMMILIQDKLRQRRKHLGRLQRHLAPVELHLWEKEEEEEDRGSKHGMAMLRQLSLGTSLSTSTLTDCGFPPLCSDGDTLETTSEAVSPDQHSRSITRGAKAKVQERENAKRSAVKIDKVIKEENHAGNADENGDRHVMLSSPPVVGTWEFELEDEEYLNFLELFLSYVLEKDNNDGGDSVGELPLLKAFCSRLRKSELHSLTFDVLTTMHRRERDGQQHLRKHRNNEPPIFRAGCCYKPMKQGTPSELQTSISRANLSSSPLPWLRAGSQTGLFGLRQKGSVSLDQRLMGGHSGCDANINQSAFLTRQPSDGLTFHSSTSAEAVIELQQVLDPKLEAQFPDLGRLLEWMLRWADRRVLVGHHGKKKLKGEGDGQPPDEGVVIRVRATVPAVLTSLSLLECRYTGLHETDNFSANIQVPETQWAVSPVLQLEVDKKLERESSVDTGYPGSANTPITGLDYKLQQKEESMGSYADEPEELMFHRTSLTIDQDELTSDDQRRPSSSHQPSFGDLDVTPEKEGKSSDNEDSEVSLSLSNGNIAGNICTPETSLKLADLDVAAKDMTSSTSISSYSHAEDLQAPPYPQTQALPAVLPEDVVHAECSDSSGALPPNTPVGPQHPQPQSCSAGAPTVVPSEPSQPSSSQTLPMRQRLGEDLFRLVQHINHISLMEVLEASFANLQVAQQNCSMAQSNMNPSLPNVPSSYAANFMSQQNVSPVRATVSLPSQTRACVPSSDSKAPQFGQAPACMYAHQLPIQSSAEPSPTGDQCHNTSIPCTASGTGEKYQEFEPLSVQAESPEIKLSEGGKLIPPSQGLLTTTDNSHATTSAPVVMASGVQTDPPSQGLGLKLLQLRGPPLPQQCALHSPSALEPQMPPIANPYQPKFKHSDQTASKRPEQEKRSGSAVPKRQLRFNSNPPSESSSMRAPHQNQTWERSSLLPPATPPPSVALPQGFRLLHSQPIPDKNIPFPKLPLPSSFRLFAFTAAPIVKTKLLHIDSEIKPMLPLAAPSPQMTHLISMEELTASIIGRQKRRENAERASKSEVTFKPNDSIIPTQETKDEPVTDEPTVKEEIAPVENIAIQLGSFDSSLTGQRLLDKAMSTAAELHAFASTCKRPPECHDAFTNTDPAQSSGNIQGEPTVQDTIETPPSQNKDLLGRHFLSVLDLDDGTRHQDLQPSSLSSAQLHVLATSVIRGDTPVVDVLPSVPDQENIPQPIMLPDIPEESPSFNDMDPNREPENVTPPDAVDPFGFQIVNAIKRPSIGRHSESSSAPTFWFSSPLSKLDSQLAGLQKIADSLEKDFVNSRMLVNTIDKLTQVSAPEGKKATTVKKTVRLLVPEEVWMSDTGTEPSEDEEEENLEELLVHNDPNSSKRQRPCTSSPIHSAGPSSLHTPSKINQTGSSGICQLWADENLSPSGLSDTAEILDELVRDGYLSLTDLDLSSSPLQTTAHNNSSRPGQQQNSWMSQKQCVLPDDEKREVRRWMRQKQRERLAVYQKHRESLREKERKPFSTTGTSKATDKKQKNTPRTREEKRAELLEQFIRRTNEACSLASDFAASPLAQPRLSVTPVPLTTRRASSAPPSHSNHRDYSVFANDKRVLKSPSEAQPHLRPWTAEAANQRPEDDRRRLGLHRPVTSLPKDRMCQITRRGMITPAKTHNKPHTGGWDEKQNVGNQRNKSSSGGTPGRKENQREQTRSKGERGALNLWRRSPEMLLIPEESESNIVSAELRHEQDDVAGVSGMNWLENLSDSSSVLSKIDWDAIERMVTEEDS
ncbi:LOW QUALITY PROTEIN: ciliogenesis and planar polarity effector 1 [Aulostomus maculatus]